MPHIEPRTSHNGKKSYRVKVRVKGYPPQSATFPTLTAAKQWGQRTEADLKEHRYFPNAQARKHTVGDLIDKYLTRLAVLNPRRHKEVLPKLTWWKAEIGTTLLSQLTGVHCFECQQKLLMKPRERKCVKTGRLTLTPSTVNRYMQALHSALAFGIKPLKWVSTNVVSEIESLEEPEGIVRYLSKEEKIALLAACKDSKNPHLFDLVLLGMSTGGRREELRQLKWENVVFDVSRITLKLTKNKQTRALFVHGAALAALEERWKNRGDNIFVFPSPNDPERAIDFESAWKFARARAKVDKFRFHDLRHTFASYLAMNGASLLELKEAMGHKTLDMVLRYAHLAPSHTASVVASMNAKELADV